MSAPSRTFNAYMYKSFLLWLLAMVLGLGFVIFLSNLVEMLRKTSDIPNVEMNDVVLLSSLQVPGLMQEILPILVFFAAVGCLWWRTRSQELVVARATGLSIWQILKPVGLAALLVGGLFSALFNPLAVEANKSLEAMETKLFGQKKAVLRISDTGFWLKENIEDQGYRLIRARQVKQRKDDTLLSNVEILEISDTSRLEKRLHAKSLILTDGVLNLRNVTDQTDPDNPVPLDNQLIKTSLKLVDARPKTEDRPSDANFWLYPRFIANSSETGLAALDPKLKYAKLLALPFILVSLVLLAALFSLRMQRKGSVGLMILSGIIIALGLHFVTDILFSFGLSGRLPVVLAIWTMPMVIGLFSTALLLQREDG